MKASLTLTCSLALLCLAMVSVTIAADVPQLINVQGKLTDAGGDPVADGAYSVVFSIYDVVTGGTALWQETRTVTVSGGLFSISLGESTTISPSLFDNTDLWLGMKVETDQEMTPRQRLTTSPYAFRAAGSSVGGGWVDDGSNVRLQTSGDKVGIGTSSPAAKLEVDGGIRADSLDLGSPTETGLFKLYSNGISNPVVWSSGTSSGGVFYTYDELSNSTIRLEPDFNGQGGFLLVSRDNTYNGFYVDGNYNGTKEPMVKIDGSTRDVTFNMSLSGDSSVALPDNAISSDEILDEPGIASANSTGSVTLADSPMQDILTVTIEIPTDGYIVLEAKCYVVFQGTTDTNRAVLQIDETAGGSSLIPHFVVIGHSIHSSTDVYGSSPYLQRVYFKSQGTYTFRFEGYRTTTSPGTATLFYPTLTATFYSKSYGSVTTVVTAAEASQFDNAVPVAVNVDDGIEGETGSSQQLYEVDLRELELENARLRAELRQVQREMDEAEARRQEEARSKQQIEK